MTSSKPPHITGTHPSSTSAEVILIADDDEFFRMALRTILMKTIEGVRILETASLDEAVECLSETDTVTLALFDLNMPGMESAASLRAIRQCFPHTLIAVVSASKRRDDILLALEAGAHGYIPKGLGAVELAAAIKTVRSGLIYVPASMADLRGVDEKPQGLRLRSTEADRDKVSAKGVGAHPDEAISHLTRRQQDVLKLLVTGMSNKEIARTLKLGEGTVKVHVAALFRVLGVTSRAAVAAAGMRLRKADKS